MNPLHSISHSILSLSLLSAITLSCASCNPKIDALRVCLIGEEKAYCNKGNEHTEPPLSELSNYVAFDEVALNLFISRKENCVPNNNNNPNHTLDDMLPCVITPTRVPLTSMPACGLPLTDLQGSLAVDRVSWGRMKNFLEYCGERSERSQTR